MHRKRSQASLARTHTTHPYHPWHISVEIDIAIPIGKGSSFGWAGNPPSRSRLTGPTQLVPSHFLYLCEGNLTTRERYNILLRHCSREGERLRVYSHLVGLEVLAELLH